MSDMTPQAQLDPKKPGRRGHESTKLDVRLIVVFLAGVGVSSVIIYLGLNALMSSLTHPERGPERFPSRVSPASPDDPEAFPAPRIQVNLHVDLVRLRNSERAELNSYGWVDRDAGIARIPIDRAIEIIAKRGLPKDKTTAPRGSRTREQP